jgi:hypothetical protein
MPEPCSKRFGDRLVDWLNTIPPWSWYNTYTLNFNKRLLEFAEWGVTTGVPLMKGYHPTWYWQVLFAYFYLVFGVDIVGVKKPVEPPPSPLADPAKAIADAIDLAAKSDLVKDLTKTMGTLITEPVVAALERGFVEGQDDPLDAARTFHGVTMGISMLGGVASSLTEGASMGLIRAIGPMMQAMYWNLGLGFLGWQTLAPLLENGLQPALRTHYMRKFRNTRFTAAQMGDLYALGRAGADEVRDTLRDLGWRDEDIARWIALSYRKLSEGDIWKLYNAKALTKSEADSRLRALGYDPDDLNLLYRLNDEDIANQTKETLISTAKSALAEMLISENEFRDILRAQKYGEREIDLEVALIRLQAEKQSLALSQSNIHTLYKGRQITRGEAVSHLVKVGMSGDTAEKMVAAWDELDAPAALRINQSTIRAAYIAGVLSRGQASEKLRGVGYSQADSTLLLDTWDMTMQLAGQTPGQPTPARLSLADLADMVRYGLMTREQLESRAELARFSADDRAKLIELLLTYKGIIPVTGPGRGLLLSAYAYGLIDRGELIRRLEDTGLSADDATLVADTEDKHLAEIAAAREEARARRPSVGALQLALERGIITEAEFDSAMADLGFGASAIALYRLNAQYQAPVAPHKLTKAELISLYKSAKLSRSEVLARLGELGYTVEDAALIVAEVGLEPQDTEMGQAFIAGYVTEEAARAWLLGTGFSAAEVDTFISEVRLGRG